MLLILFACAFGAATLLPLQSEAILLAVSMQRDYPVSLPLFVASTGNILGSCVNWYVGQQLARYKERTWFPIKPTQLAKAQERYARYGSPALLLSWVPIIGDPITLIAGVLKEPFWRFIWLVSIAKTARYAFIIAIAQHWV